MTVADALAELERNGVICSAGAPAPVPCEHPEIQLAVTPESPAACVRCGEPMLRWPDAGSRFYSAAEVAELERRAKLADAFYTAYVACALWSTLDRRYEPDDLSDEARETMRADCEAFIDRAAEHLPQDQDAYAQAGHDFLLTRNHEGVGFWDGDWQEPVTSVLTEIAHSFGEVSLYEAHGVVHHFPAEPAPRTEG